MTGKFARLLFEHPKTRVVRTRDGILQAAIELFAERGFEETTLREIGERAGVSRGAPRYVFGSKEALYQAALAQVLAEAGDALAASADAARVAELGPEETLREAVGSYIDFLADNPRFVRLIEWEALGHGGALQDMPEHLEMAAAALGGLAGCLADELQPGLDPVQLLLSVAGLCWVPMAQRATLGRALGADGWDTNFIEARKRHVADLILGGAAHAGLPHKEGTADG